MNPAHAVVVDASVALKWVLMAEEYSDRAQALLERCIRTRRPLVAPPHLPSEVTNALFQRTRRKDDRLTDEEAAEALAQFVRLPVELLNPTGLYEQAFAFAKAHGLKDTYDSLYIVLADMLGVAFWTDDRALLKAVGLATPWVQWIGDHPLK